MANNTTIRTFSLSDWAVNNRTSVYLIIFILVIMGILSYNGMPKESFPEIKQPQVYVNTIYPGNSPVDMENLVSRPIEKELNTITGVKKISSKSIQDVSVIIVDFEYDIPVEDAYQDVKDAVDKVKKDLPTDLPTDPVVQEMDISELMPVMNVNISGNYSQEQLKEFAEYLEDKIEDLPQISAVDISGVQEDEVEIAIDKNKMEALAISLDDVENAVRGENATISGGDIKVITGDDISRRNLRIDGEFKDYRTIEDVIVKNEDQHVVYLRDIGKVRFGPKEPTSFARLNGQPVLTLDVKKKAGENLLTASASIKNIIADAQENHFPKDLNVIITNDQSKETISIVNNLENSIIMGVILVVLVLMFFLGLRNSLFVGIAIPLSMLMGIAILDMGGNTMNMMVLFSLILALGMLVDNGIVVVENIFRMRQEGKNAVDSSRQGVGEVATAIISSTATTLAAFIPLLFWDSLMGEFMKFLPITLIIVLASSLFVALVINPVLTTDLMTVDIKKPRPLRKFWIRNAVSFALGMLIWLSGTFKILGALFVIGALFSIIYRFALKPFSIIFQEKIMPVIENFYIKTIRFALKRYNPVFLLIGTFVLLIFSIIFFSVSGPKVLFFPETDPKMVFAYIETPIGTDIEQTNEIVLDLEKKINKAIDDDRVIVEAVLAQVGENTGDPMEGMQPGSSPNKAKITVSFYDYEKRTLDLKYDTSTSTVMKKINAAVSDDARAKITVAKNVDGPPVGKPINVEVHGENFLELIAYVEQIKKKMESANVPGVDQLKTDLELGKPMLEIHINRDAARRFGLSTGQIGQTIRTALFGKEISKYKKGEDEYEIQMRFMDEYRYNLSDLLDTRITFRNQTTGKIVQVPVSAVADIEFNTTYGSVKRLDLERVISIFSEVEEGYNANEIVAEYKKILADLPPKEGYAFEFTGEQQEQAETMAFMIRALMIAIFVIFLIIVTQFNSIIGPLIIMGSVLFSTIGVFLGFAIFKMPFVILMCGIGIISLAGVVVNNAIVLIDYINLLRKRRREELGVPDGVYLSKTEIVNTIIDGGKTRLRPVLLTAITTVLGLIPLALGLNINFGSLLADLDPMYYTGGDNASFWGPMAWTVIFGLTFATFLTLVIVPVMYLLADMAMIRLKKAMKDFGD